LNHDLQGWGILTELTEFTKVKNPGASSEAFQKAD